MAALNAGPLTPPEAPVEGMQSGELPEPIPGSGLSTCPGPNAPSTLRSAPQSTVQVFRVEGNVNARVAIGEGGAVAIADGDNMLFLNFGDKARAEAFLAKRLEQGMAGATAKSFEVPQSFLDELRASAVPEALAGQNPGKPIIVDVTKAADQFGLNPQQIEALKKAIIQGTGKTGL